VIKRSAISSQYAPAKLEQILHSNEESIVITYYYRQLFENGPVNNDDPEA